MRVIVVHGLREDSRLTNILHTTSFARHLGGCEVVYTNVYGAVKRLALDQSYDLGIITYEVLGLRTAPEWGDVRRRIKDVIAKCRTKIAFPQDDYTCNRKLDDLFTDLGFDFVFTPITKDLQFLYPNSFASGVKFAEFLTGYWESGMSPIADGLNRPFALRSWDLGQRIRQLPVNLGSQATLKSFVTTSFAEHVSQQGLECDVSVRDGDAFLGTRWWSFLGDCRFTVGSRGGASVADPIGRLARRVELMATFLPNLSRTSIRRITGLDRVTEHDFSAVGPRLFEAAAMGTCQVLLEDTYLEGFEPWKHYLPLKRDLSNLNELTHIMRDFDRCSEIALEARRTLIESGRFSYSRAVVEFMLKTMKFAIKGNQVDLVDGDQQLFPSGSAIECTSIRNESKLQLVKRKAVPSFEVSAALRSWKDEHRSGNLIAESFFRPWIGLSRAMDLTSK